MSTVKFPTQTAFNALLSSSDRARRDPVWKHSTRRETRYVRITRADRDRLWHRARRLLTDRLAKWILHTLLYDFLNLTTGRLDPSWEGIGKAALCSVSTVYRRLKMLRAKGLLAWETRCSGSMQDGRYVLEQNTNAYHVDASWAESKPPTPEYGAHPPEASALARAAEATTRAARQAALELEPDDPLTAAIARLHKARP